MMPRSCAGILFRGCLLTDDGGCIEHGVYSGLGVVAHYESAELQACAQESVGGIVPEFYLGVVVFEVGCNASCAEIAPFTDDGVA